VPKKESVRLRDLSTAQLVREYTSAVRKAWGWRQENFGAHAGRSPLYQRELSIKREVIRRLSSSR